MNKIRILIVEDEALLYKRMKTALKAEGFKIDEFTQSVEEAIIRINSKRPDVVLLDISLSGDLTGIDLGKRLSEEYKIPFIYVTSHDDNFTFQKGLNTNHESYLVKTKPRLKIKEVLRAIQTLLYKQDQKKEEKLPIGIWGLIDYVNNLRHSGKEEITSVLVDYQEIGFFTSDVFENIDAEFEKPRSNYIWFLTGEKEYYFYNSSLSDLLKHLPPYFVRVNDKYIINLSPNILKGKLIGSRLYVVDRAITISDTYKSEVKRRLKAIYK